jgi:PKD repeat protein
VSRCRQLIAAHRSPWWSRGAFARLALASLAAGCGGGDLVIPGDGGALSIKVVAGDGQRGSVGEPLGGPVVVEVTDAGDDPVEGATVEFALTSAGTGAEITPATAHTDGAGRAQAFVLLGDKVGLQTGTARVAGTGSSPVTSFAALAVSVTGGGTPPSASFTWNCDQLTCAFTDGSTDTDGSVTGWVWSFGDGGGSTERNPSHDYSASGTYSVTLTVTDDDGLSDIVSNQVTATAASNASPRAEFAVSCADLNCTFTDQSTDADGTVASWHWDFGDGATSTQRSPSRRYASAGRYDVLLMVTDDDGAADTKTHPAEPTAPPPSNEPPQADFDIHCDHLVCSFADKSKDDDGTIVSWQWSFGDGSSSTEQNPMHTYGTPGHYTVLLTVTDDGGASTTKDRRADLKK